MGFGPANPFEVAKQQNKKKEFRPWASDRLVEITAYDTSKGLLFGKDRRGVAMCFRIDYNAIARNKKFEQTKAKFFGHLINEEMEKALPIGHSVVIERAVYKEKMKTENGTINLYEAQRVINSTEQDAEKLFEGIFTIEAYKDRVQSVQHWSDKSFDPKDKSRLAMFAGDLAKRDELFKQGERVEHLGFMLRALRKSEDGNWVCVDSSYPMDHIVLEDDGKNKYVPIWRDRFVEICKEYLSYLKEKGLSDVSVDVMTYRNLRASIQAKSMALGTEFSALSKMSSKQSLCSVGDEAFLGKNWAVRGIVELSGDEVKRDGKSVSLITRNLVMKLHANGFNCDVREMVLAHDGGKVKLSDELKVSGNYGEFQKPMNSHLSYEAKEFFDADFDPFGDSDDLFQGE